MHVAYFALRAHGLHPVSFPHASFVTRDDVTAGLSRPEKVEVQTFLSRWLQNVIDELAFARANALTGSA
jgi:hypothetical protein